ncbi:MAG: head GIN domain-containing protein [Planctomycetota bacterium JB042]
MSLVLRVALILAPFFLFGCSIHVGDGVCWGRHGVRGSGVVATVAHERPTFTRVEVRGALELVVEIGPPTPVEVSGDDNILPHLRIEVVGDRLIVEPRHSISPRCPLVVRATSPDLREIEASGATEVVVHGLDAAVLSLDVSGASEVRVDGRCDHLEAEVSGASDLELTELVAETAEIEASGASDADLRVDADLHARVSGAASVRNHGPGAVRGHVSGAGSLEPRSG